MTDIGPLQNSQIFVHDPGVTMRVQLKMDKFEQSFLTIARHIMANFETPEDHCWMAAFMEAEQVFPVPYGATIAHAITISINALRRGRSTPFGYFKPDNPLAETAMTREERYLILVLQGVRRSELFSVRKNALMVCEGSENADFLAAIERICIITGDVSEPVLQRA